MVVHLLLPVVLVLYHRSLWYALKAYIKYNGVLYSQVWPASCPYQGGTDVTISGTDLGVVVDDIINITIGGAPCMIHRDSYQPGVG